MFRAPATFGPPRMSGPPRMFGGRGPAAATGVESEWCLSFDGVDGSVFVSHADMPVIGTSYTVCAWFYVAATASNTYRFVFGKESAVGWSGKFPTVLIANSSGIQTLAVFIGDSSGSYNYFPCATVIHVGAWYHLAVIVNGSSVTCMLNGSVEMSGVITCTPADNTQPFRVGARNLGDSTAYNLKGRVDDIRSYSRAISPTEVTALYTNISPPTTGLTLHLPMEEGTGTTTVDSVGGVTATLVGGATWHPQTPPKLVSGRNTIVRSLSLDGVDDYITMGNPPELAGNVAVTLSAWVKPNSSATLGVVAGKAVNNLSDQEFWIEYGRGSSATFRTVWGGGLVNQSATHPPGVWYHVALVRSGEAGSWTSKLCVDGVEEDSKTITYNPRGNGGFVVGRAGNSNAEYVSASISSVIAFFRALSPTEVQKLCRGQNPTTNDPVGWWKGDETSGTLVVDYGLGGHDGTCVGGVTRSTDVPAWLAP